LFRIQTDFNYILQCFHFNIFFFKNQVESLYNITHLLVIERENN